jgi:hypothetical protein
MGKIAIDDVKIGPADGAGLDADADLASARLRIRPGFESQRPTGRVKYHRPHRALPSGDRSDARRPLAVLGLGL